MPVQADAPNVRNGYAGPGHTTIQYNGPVIHGSADGAQLAWNNSGDISQQRSGDQIAPGFEALAQAVVSTLQGLPAVGLPARDLGDAQAAAEEVLAEVAQQQPDPGRIRRAVAALKGLLSPIATGLAVGAGAGAQDWARTAIEQLGLAVQQLG